MLKKFGIAFLFCCFMGIFSYAQDRKAMPRNGEGVDTFLMRHHLSVRKYKQRFLDLNKGKFGRHNSLLIGTSYILPNNKKRTSYNESLFGRKYAKFRQRTNALSGAVFYIVSGHGGPDPGAIGRYNGKALHEDEYAYDVALRLARKLMENGAKVYTIIQDEKDGIRDDAILSRSRRETCRGKKIPLSQIRRLKQRVNAVNQLYKKDRRAKYKRCIVLHVDSRGKGKQLDVFFYHNSRSYLGKRLAKQMSATFEKEYRKHQPNRGFSGTVGTRGLYVVRKITPPLVFIELGNIQNRSDQLRFVKSNNRQALANWLYEGVLADYRVSRK